MAAELTESLLRLFSCLSAAVPRCRLAISCRPLRLPSDHCDCCQGHHNYHHNFPIDFRHGYARRGDRAGAAGSEGQGGRGAQTLRAVRARWEAERSAADMSPLIFVSAPSFAFLSVRSPVPSATAGTSGTRRSGASCCGRGWAWPGTCSARTQTRCCRARRRCWRRRRSSGATRHAGPRPKLSCRASPRPSSNTSQRRPGERGSS